MFRESLAASVEPVAGIHALLDWAEADGAGCAVVTNAPRDNAVAMLAAAASPHRLPTLVIGDECARPKPDPAPYRAGDAPRSASRPSRSSPSRTRRSGLRAARGSGAHVFGMTTGLAPDELLAAPAPTPRIADFTDPALWAHLDQLEGPRRMTRTIVESRSQDRHHRLRPAVLRDRRAHQPDRAQEARRRARGRRLLHRRGRRARAGRLRRHDARRQRRRRLQLRTRNPQRDRAAADAADDRARARPGRRSAFASTQRPRRAAGRPRGRARAARC